MPNREKVISGLHCRAQDLMIDPPACDGCDYQVQMVNRMECDFRRLCRDAISLLKEQEQEISFLKAMQLQTVKGMDEQELGNIVGKALGLWR